MKKVTFLIVLLTFFFSWYGTAQITSYPYSEDFEAGAGGWVATNGANGTWALGAPTATVINSAASGANAWATNLSGNYNANDNSSVQSPVFDLSSLTAPSIQLSIWWNSEFSWDGTVLQSSIDSGVSWQNVGAFGDPNNWYNDNTINGGPGGQPAASAQGWTGRNSTSNGSSGWVVARHALTGLAGQSNVILRFAFASDGTIQDNGVAFDSVSVFEVTCPEPSGLMVDSQTATTANISWTPGGTESNWEVAVQPAGTGLPSGSGDPTMSNAPYVAMSLTPATAYEVYVRSVCGSEFSPWVGAANFLTECTTFIAPYTEDFENAGTIPICWSMSGGEVWRFSNVGTGNHIGNNGVITGSTASNGYFAWVDSSGTDAPATLLSPLVDVSGLTTPALSFFEISNNEGNANSTLTVDVWDGAAWNNVGIYNTNTAGWELKIIDLSALTITGDVQARFVFSETVGGDFYDDIAIDDVTFDEAPLCIIPSGLVVANVTGTTADVSWNAGTGTAWEYVIQPAGTGVPSGNGTALTVTTVNETGLSFSTAYEVYIRRDCGTNGFSDWVGPLTFTTTIQTNFIVDCNAGPVNSVSCYDSDDDITQIRTFTSSDGVTQLNITFNSGNVEWNAFGNEPYDDLIVLDSDGVTELYNGGGATGNVAGLTFQSSGPTISYYVDADFTISCQSSTAINPLDVTVTCATCNNPAATYTVIDDCASGNQFLIDVNITSIGDANTLTITDNQGSPGVQVSGTGVVQFGPYPFATPIIITVSNDDDINCVINSTPIQVAACPPANDNCGGATEAGVNIGSSCDITTPGTILAANPSGVPTGSCAGNPDDDVWFQFTALHEVELISINNITGGTTNLDHAVYSGGCGALTELYCSPNTSSVTPLLTVGSTYYIRIFSFGGVPETSTFNLCIQQAPANTVCEQAANFCSAGGSSTGPNVIGFPSPGSIACLATAPNPSWNIIQIGDPGLVEIEISQFNNATPPAGLDVDFVLWGPFDTTTDFCSLGLEVDCPSCPNNTTNPNFYPFGNIVDCSYDPAFIENATINNAQTGELYVLLVTNFSGQSGNISIEQTNTGGGTTVADIQVSLGADVSECGVNSVVLTANSPFADTYEWYADGFQIPGETGPTLTVTESNTYTVLVYDSQCDVSAQDEVVVTLGLEPVANAVADIVTCDDISGDGFEEFNLESQTATILGGQDPSLFNVTYHLSSMDATSGVGALTSPYTNISNPQTIWIRVEDANSTNCIAPRISFQLIITGATPTATSADMTLCDDLSGDGFESFNLTSNDVNILNGQSPTDFTVSYYPTLADADAGMNQLTSPYTNTTNPQTIWARVDNNTAVDCYATTSFNLVVNLPPTVNASPEIAGCDTDDNNIAEYDLTENEDVITGGTTGLTVTYYTTMADANAGIASTSIGTPSNYETSLTTIFVRVVDTVTGCYNVTSFDLVAGVLPMTTFTTDFDYEVCPNATIPIVISVIPQNYTTSDVSIVWYQDGGVIGGENGLTLPVLTQGFYEVEVTFNATGCKDVVGQQVIELDNCIIPQGISPDNDGKNDTFDLSNFNVTRIEIFNRLGTLVYSKDNYTNEWRGQSNNGDELPVGTYFYTMVYEGGTKQLSAWVYINK